MESSARTRHDLTREALLCAAAAASVAAVLAYLGPPGSDLAAHAYQRTLFLEHGFTLWNNFWYAGRYSFITYSVLYYPLAALLGIRLLAVATIALASLAFSVIVWREWGRASRWSSRTFAVVWAGIVLSAAFPFALGIAIALLAIWALQRNLRWRFAALAVLTLAASPVAFLLLAMVVGGIALARHRWSWVPFAAIAGAGLVEIVLWRLFPGGGSYPFSLAEVSAGVVFALLGLLCTWNVESLRPLRFLFAIYLVALLVSYLVPSAVGENVARLRYVAIPLAVLVFSVRRWKPLPLALGVLVLAISWNVSPLAASFQQGQSDTTASAATWQPVIGFLRNTMDADYRVEAVDTAGHWPAVYLADANIPLARGWFRQDDFPQNQVLYSELGSRAYLQWLRGLGVAYVVLSNAPPDYSARAETALLRSGRSGLTRVFHTRQLAVYAVPRPRAIVTGPHASTVLSMTQSRITLVVSHGGTYRIAVRWSPYWHASTGCLRRGGDGMLRVQTRAARDVTLTFAVNASRALGAMTGDPPDCRLGTLKP